MQIAVGVCKLAKGEEQARSKHSQAKSKRQMFMLAPIQVIGRRYGHEALLSERLGEMYLRDSVPR